MSGISDATANRLYDYFDDLGILLSVAACQCVHDCPETHSRRIRAMKRKRNQPKE